MKTKKKVFLIGISILVGLVIIMFLGYVSKEGAISIPFETIAKGDYVEYRFDYPIYTVLTNEYELNQFLDELGSAAKENIYIPKEEFENYFLIVAYYVAPSTGYSIEIKKILQDEEIINVTVILKKPKAGLDVVTTPYHIVRVKKDNLAHKGKLTFIFKDTDEKKLSEKVTIIK